jgi:Domain of unknown function (DUF4263)
VSNGQRPRVGQVRPGGRKELTDYEKLLNSKKNLSEQKDIIPFFKDKKHLSTYIGTLYLDIAVATDVCPEFDIGGNFRADLLLGSKAEGKFCIVEFEPGDEGSLFKKHKRKNPEWSPRFEHAFSQIVDWFWALEDGENTKDFRATFGDGAVTFASLLVMGRNTDLDDPKRRRLIWRTNKVLIDSNKVTCITFDHLYDALKRKFEFYTDAAEAEKGVAAPGLPPPIKSPGKKKGK